MARRNIVERYIKATVDQRIDIILNNYSMGVHDGSDEGCCQILIIWRGKCECEMIDLLI